jgi:hypothetical protein
LKINVLAVLSGLGALMTRLPRSLRLGESEPPDPEFDVWPQEVRPRQERWKTGLLRSPVDVLVLVVLRAHPGARCADILQHIAELRGDNEVGHQAVWNSVKKLARQRWIRRDTRFAKSKRIFYRLRGGSGSHVRAEVKRWENMLEALQRGMRASQQPGEGTTTASPSTPVD